MQLKTNFLQVTLMLVEAVICDLIFACIKYIICVLFFPFISNVDFELFFVKDSAVSQSVLQLDFNLISFSVVSELLITFQAFFQSVIAWCVFLLDEESLNNLVNLSWNISQGCLGSPFVFHCSL